MLFATADRLKRNHESHDLPWDLEMACIESFTVHARSLIDLLWKDKSFHRNDGLAEHYFEPGRWAQLSSPMESTLHDVRSRVGREIAHVSYSRTQLAPQAREWQFEHIAASIGRCLRVFLDNVANESVVPGFEAAVRGVWPEFLNYPVAISWPPTEGALSVPTRGLGPSERP